MLDGKVVRETCLNSTVDYFYDNDGRPYKFTVKVGANDPVEGYYVLNLQGDVIAILDKKGAVAVEYEYDSWGNILMDSAAEQTGQTGQTLKFYNALKYRGYYYDSDLEMYYLNSRFYDPAISRFINADSGISGNGEELLGYNMYTYCFNNPVNLDDSEGNWPSIRSIVRKVVAVVVKGVNSIINRRNKKKIEKGLKQSYTPSEAERAISNIVNNSSNEVTANITTNKGTTIYNSYSVSSRYERQEVTMILERTYNGDGSKVTGRTASDMAAEWLWHNWVYKVTSYFAENETMKHLNNRGQDASLDYKEDNDPWVWIPTRILSIWGFE